MKKHASKKKVRYFHMGPWPIYLGVMVGSKAFQEESERLTGKRDDDKVTPNGGMCVRYEHDNTLPTILIVIGDRWKDLTRTALAGLAAHEATHAVDRIFQYTGEREPGSEARAYLVGYITQCVMTHLTKPHLEARSIFPAPAERKGY
ncbi:MAG TPA: hypothetical protein VN838_05620 [Bradyrhizobium sp.]|nr:hypothetical protein [Bradyrhizobium sp.]